MPYMQTKYSNLKDFGIDKQSWVNIYIYINKIKLIQGKRIAEFNYKMLNNILSITYFKVVLMIITNTNVKIILYLWKIVSEFIGFEVEWKHIIYFTLYITRLQVYVFITFSYLMLF